MAESEFADHQTSRTASGTSATEWTLSTVRCCPAKLAAAPSSSMADERTANGADNAATAFATFSVASGDDKAIEKVAKAVAALSAPFAVRSSAIDEDGPAASFAGPHLPVLNGHSVAEF